MSQTPARHQRSGGGLLGALVVLVVLVVGWTLLRNVVAQPHNDDPQTVDWTTVVPLARKQAGFDLLAPHRLPAGWQATSVRFDTGTSEHWHLGLLTAQGRYLGLEQGPRPVAAMVHRYVGGAARRLGEVQVHGRRWSTYDDPEGDRALVRRASRTTTLVVGHDVPRAQMVAFAAGLR